MPPGRGHVAPARARGPLGRARGHRGGIARPHAVTGPARGTGTMWQRTGWNRLEPAHHHIVPAGEPGAPASGSGDNPRSRIYDLVVKGATPGKAPGARPSSRADHVESFPLCQIMSLSRRLVRVMMGQTVIKPVRDS